MQAEQVVLLNQDWSFLNIVTWKRAMSLVMKEKVVVLKYSEKIINTAESVLKIPSVMRMVYAIDQIWRNSIPFTKKNLFIRDGHRCGYCGSYNELTIDHVIPKSRGGKTNFENCVTCCRTCNVKKKQDKTPKEAGMTLRKHPYKPNIGQFLKKKMEKYKVYEFLKEINIY